MYRDARSCCQPSSVSADAGVGGAEAGADDKRALGEEEDEPLDRTTTWAWAADALATVEGCCAC